MKFYASSADPNRAIAELEARAFARDSAAHAREIVSSQDDLTRHIASSENVQKELTDLNIRYVREIEALNATNAQSIRDRQVADQQALDKDTAIMNLTAQISTAMEIDTDDAEILKNRLAERSVTVGNLEIAFGNLESIYKDLQT
eukprot:15376545-Heterocapsa_arctica.AAC.1